MGKGKKIGPYIGVTGFMSRAEVKAALKMVPETATRRLMVGILMGAKSLRGEMNKWPGRYPKREAVADIFVDDSRALNLIHYTTDDPSTLCDQLEEMVALAGPALDGFQLNIVWPPIEELQKFRQRHPEMYIVLQIGKKAMTDVYDLLGFAPKFVWYVPLVDSILFDPSGGNGEPFDPAEALQFLLIFQSQFESVGIGVAGGLGPNDEDMKPLREFIRELSGLSWDAEGKIRTPFPEDALSIDAMKSYLGKSYEIDFPQAEKE